MNIIGPNRFASFFELSSLDSDVCQSYTQLKENIAETDLNIQKLKTKLHGLIMSRPVDLFTESEDNGSVIDQVNDVEQSVYSDLEALYNQKHDLECVMDMVENTYYIISNNKIYDNMSKEEKYNLAFDAVVYRNKTTLDLKNPKYYLHKPNAYKEHRDIIYSVICNDRSICDVKDRVRDNIATYDYNDGRPLTVINNIFRSVYNTDDKDSNKAYIIYIKDNKSQKHIFVNNGGQWMFNTRDEAVRQLSDIRGVSALDYCTYDYIKRHIDDMFSADWNNGFFREFEFLNDNDNIITKEVITNIFRLYYNKNTDTDYSEIIKSLEHGLNHYTDYIISRLKGFISKFSTMTQDEFKNIMSEYYRTLCNPGTEYRYENDFNTDMSEKDRLPKIDSIIRSVTDYTLLNIFVSAVLKYYLYRNVYEIKEIEF